MNKEALDRFARALPALQNADPGLLEDFRRHTSLARIAAGEDIFVEGDRVDAIALLISGVVRVYKIGETGREITLYRFGDGQSCILTANAILSRRTFPAVATVERRAEAAMVPADTFRDWVRRHEGWREFVFDLLSQRLSSVMELVEEVAFRRMDVRLAAFLLAQAPRQNPIRMTHQEIAAELGSSREVISRLLEDLAERGVIRAGRGQIELLEPASLEAANHN